MRLKWYGTTTILLEQDGTQLLFDPFIPLSKKVFQPPVEEFAAVENIFITHGHFDHVARVPVILKQSDKKNLVYCTSKPKENLILKGLEEEQIHEISPDGVLDLKPFTVRVLKGKHIIFDIALLLKTFLSPRIIANWGKFISMLKENKEYGEFGETVVYDIQVPGKRILLMGSLNLDENTIYPEDADLLIMPFQGRSDINTYSMQFIERLQPKRVLLVHFDDSFPPISSRIDTGPFISLMRQRYPGIPVISLQASAEWVDWEKGF